MNGFALKLYRRRGPGPALKDFTFGFNLTQDTLDFSFLFFFFFGTNSSSENYKWQHVTTCDPLFFSVVLVFIMKEVIKLCNVSQTTVGHRIFSHLNN